MWIFSTLDQMFGAFGAKFVILFAISLALPLVLGLLARLFIFSSDTDDAGTDGAASQSPNHSKVSQPDFRPTDWDGRFTHVKILAPAKEHASRRNSNRKTGGTRKKI